MWWKQGYLIAKLAVLNHLLPHCSMLSEHIWGIGLSSRRCILRHTITNVASRGGHWHGKWYRNHSMWGDVQKEGRFLAQRRDDGRWGSGMKEYQMEVSRPALPSSKWQNWKSRWKLQWSRFQLDRRTNFLKIKDVGCSSWTHPPPLSKSI